MQSHARARARTRARVRTCAILDMKKRQKFMPIFEQNGQKQGYRGTFDHDNQMNQPEDPLYIDIYHASEFRIPIRKTRLSPPFLNS